MTAHGSKRFGLESPGSRSPACRKVRQQKRVLSVRRRSQEHGQDTERPDDEAGITWGRFSFEADMNSTMLQSSRKNIGTRIVLSLVLMLAANCASAFAQAKREVVDSTNGFRITLVEDWRAASYTDAVGREKVEFVSLDRNQGLLRITRQHLYGSSLQDYVRREVNNFTLTHSCVLASEERFSGPSLSGIRVALYYAEGGRSMVGTFYYLQEREAVWILRFVGRAGSPGMARGITDTTARSFCSICASP
jgi:hypothetical protein